MKTISNAKKERKREKNKKNKTFADERTDSLGTQKCEWCVRVRQQVFV